LNGRSESRGLGWGFVGVVAFSLTLPATRAAVSAIEPFFLASTRSLFAGTLAVCVLLATRPRIPTREEWKGLAGAAAGVVFGFPFLMTWAMQEVPSSHGAVVLAIMPLTTAMAGAWVAHERPSVGFWIVGLLGSAAVVAFALRHGGGAMTPGDLALVIAVLLSSYGYAAGAKASGTLGGWQAISWTLVLALPILLVLSIVLYQPGLQHAPVSALAGWLYVGLVSQYRGFFAWFRGLAQGGIARVGQLQLLQPFLTIAASAWLLGEALRAEEVAFALVVVVLVAIGRRMPVRRRPV